MHGSTPHAGGLAARRVQKTYKVHAAFGEDREREDALQKVPHRPLRPAVVRHASPHHHPRGQPQLGTRLVDADVCAYGRVEGRGRRAEPGERVERVARAGASEERTRMRVRGEVICVSE